MRLELASVVDDPPGLDKLHIELLVALLNRSPEHSIFDPPEWYDDTWPEPYEDLVDWGLIDGIKHWDNEDGTHSVQIDSHVGLTEKGRRIAESAIRRRSTAGGGVFVSYVRDDSTMVDQLCAALDGSGVLVWRDVNELLPGDDWKVVIRRAIESGVCFIACFSSDSEQRSRSYMREELVLAIEELRRRPVDSKWFIPVLLDEVEVPDLPIGAGRTLRDLQNIRWSSSDRAATDRLLKSLDRRHAEIADRP